MNYKNKLKGLSDKEVEKIRSDYGYNELIENNESKLWWFFKKFLNPITLMIEFALLLSLIAHKTEDLVIIAILLIVNVSIEMWQEHKASTALEALKSTLTPEAVVLRNGKFITLPARELVPGDIVKIILGDIVPADAEIISDKSAEVDQSSITGESLAVEKSKGDILYATSIMQKGAVYARITAIGMMSFIGKTAELVNRAEVEESSHFQKAIIGIGKFLAILSLILIVLVSVVLFLKGDSLLEIMQFSLVLAIASIPVALPAVLSVTMAVGATKLSKHNAIVSNFKAVEELASIDMLCVDKTGTLTKNELTIIDPVVYGDFSLSDLFTYGLLTSEDVHKSKIELAIEAAANDNKIFEKQVFKKYKIKNFISFTPDTKVTRVEVDAPDGEYFVMMGAPQVISRLLTNDADSKLLDSDVDRIAKEGLRSLVMVKQSGEIVELVGLMPIVDPPRDDSKIVIKAIQDYGVGIKMITGDHLAVAKFIGKLLSLGGRVRDTISLNKSKNKATLIGKTDIFAEVVPEDKYNIIDALQNSGHIVAMTGDGVNDAPALKKADIGIAVAGASPAAQSAADVILLDSGLNTIRVALEYARQVFARMQGYATFRIAETIRIIFFVSLSVFFFGFTPLPALMIVLLALLNDIPVMAMAYDNAIISDGPVRWNLKETLTISMILGIAGVISSMIFLTFMLFHGFSMAVIFTALFVKLDVSGHSTLYTTRTGRKHFWERPFPSLTFFIPAFSSRIIGTLLALFGVFMASISVEMIGYIWLYAFVWFLFNDMVKVFAYRVLDRRK